MQEPSIIKDHPIEIEQISPAALSVLDTLLHAGYEAYLVGGCVRDLLLDLHPKDFDVATNATPEQIHGLFRRSRIIGRRFRLVHVRVGREVIETSTFRAGLTDWDELEDDSGNQAGMDVHQETGRLLSDNVYGNAETDALRRDFTVNALYLRRQDWAVLDYCNGVADLDARLLRVIGEADQRYREDPVRMLRAIRLATKLDFELEPETAAAIPRCREMLSHIPAARLFDEYGKLLLYGHGLATWQALLRYQLVDYLFPSAIEPLQTRSEWFPALAELALRNTDRRLREGLRITPAFLIAVLLWPAYQSALRRHEQANKPPPIARQHAGAEVMQAQSAYISIPKRFSMPVREMWELQDLLGRRGGNRAERLVTHKRFRAAYDFLLLREQCGEVEPGLGDWWTRYQDQDEEGRAALLAELPAEKNRPRRRRRPRKRKPA